MNTELEVMPAEVRTVSTELSAPADKALVLFSPFQKPFAAAAELLAKESEATDAKSARELRLKMVKARTAITATKDEAKADIKLAGNIIDWYHNKGRDQLAAAEARLREIEEAEERKEAARKAALKAERTAELSAYGVDCQFYQLGEMPDEGYRQLLESSKVAFEARKAAEAKAAEEARIAAEKAEQERKAKEAAELAERERIKAENARLQAEKQAAEKAAKMEREKAEAAARKAAEEKAAIEARAKAEREAAAEAARKERESIEAKAKAEAEKAAQLAKMEREKREALEKAERERIAAENERKAKEAAAARAAAAAPDKEKLVALANALKAIAMPEMATIDGKASLSRIEKLLSGVVEQIRHEYKTL